MSRVASYAACSIVLAVIAWIAIITEVANPLLSRTELLATFWPRYVLIVILLSVALCVVLTMSDSRRP